MQDHNKMAGWKRDGERLPSQKMSLDSLYCPLYTDYCHGGKKMELIKFKKVSISSLHTGS